MRNGRLGSGTRRSAVEFFEFAGRGISRRAVECGQFGDELPYRHTELVGACLKRIGGTLVDLDVDRGAHASRIP